MRKYLLLAALVLAGCASPAVRAPWRSYDGALKENQCHRYAVAAVEDLTLRGVTAFYVSYSWSNGNETGKHAVAIFQDEKGWFLLDNVMAWPLRVRGGTVLEMVKCYDSSAYCIWQSEILMPMNWF